ncbi:heme oxygenase-domain-containing protein [Cokeromyces recurvatus]|uniref:heme oxygenase-domain-containing protein n=1 Tax=Cokeromyces recurvatus TaxID=90255 RepID=UPI00221F6342|nr:heme oxygenase-domain-containing protein [Cokeromyces recurvatus]KAI7898656.1 heme oxygenase-domain-containing protein [Cokeromyces recurvatus]
MNRFLPETQSKKGQDYLSDPQLASAMKEGTKVVHSLAENSIFTKRFLNGTITKAEYGRYINSLYYVYKTMEDLLYQHRENPTVKMVYFPHELNRVTSLIKDLEHYYGRDRVAELIDFKNVTPAVKDYIKTLHTAAERNPSLLIAHSYVRYLGDLSGGQILAKRLKKHVLNLDVTDLAWDSSEGLEFYNFRNIENHAEFKNVYRSRLDNAHVTQSTKESIIAEAIYSFELNIALFDEIQALSDANKLQPTLDELITLKAHKKTKKLLPNADWIVGFITGMATLAFSISLYSRLYERS